MAWLKKVLTKPRYALAVSIWNACSVYIGSLQTVSPELLTLVNTVGNLVIIWLGVEGGHEQGKVAEN